MNCRHVPSPLARRNPVRFIAEITLLLICAMAVPSFAQAPRRSPNALPTPKVHSGLRPLLEPPSAVEEPPVPQEMTAEEKASFEAQQEFVREHPIAVVDDWISRHVVYSDPGTEQDAIAKGKHTEWLRTVNDPRYIMQQLKRGAPMRGPGPEALYNFEQQQAAKLGEPGWQEAAVHAVAKNNVSPAPGGSPLLERDWSLSLGGGGVAPNVFPAKFDSIYGLPSCTKDYIAYPVNAAGSATQAMIVIVTNIYPFCNGGVPTVTAAYRYTTNGIVQTSPVTSLDGTLVMFVESLTAAQGGSRVHVLKIGNAGTYGPTLYNTGTVTAPSVPVNGSLTCTAAPGCDKSVTLIGTVNVTRSALYLDYNTGNGWVGDDTGQVHQINTVQTAPVESTACGTANGYVTPCWPLAENPGFIQTSPVYDAVTYNVYWGDSSGVVGYYKTANSDFGAGGGYCFDDFAAISSGAPCWGAWYQYFDGEYFAGLIIGDAYPDTCDGSATGIIADSAIVDGFYGNVWYATGTSCIPGEYCPTYSFPAVSGSGTGVGPNTTEGAPVIYQLNSGFVDGGGGIVSTYTGAQTANDGAMVCLGAPTTANLHLGAFDNLWYTSANGNGGHLYWSAPDATTHNPAIFYTTLGLFNSTNSTITAVGELTHLNSLAGSSQDASPLSEVYNPYFSTDWLAAGVTSNSCGGANGNCGGATNCGCVMTYNISSVATASASFGPWLPNTYYAPASEIVDTQGDLWEIAYNADAGTSLTSTPPWPVSPAPGTRLSEGSPAPAKGYGTVVTGNIAVGGAPLAGTSSFMFTAQPASELSNADYPGIYAGDQFWWFECASGSTGTTDCPTTDYSTRYAGASNVILIGNTLPNTLLNVVAALNNLAQTSCGYRDPTTTDSGYNTCYRTSAAQTYVTAASDGVSKITLTSTVTGTAGNGTAPCYQNYGFEPYDVYEGEPNEENITPFASTCNTGGSGSGSCGQIVINGVSIYASCPTSASDTGTFTSEPVSGAVTITTSSGSETLTPSVGTQATATGTFTATPTAGQYVTITSGANAVTLTATSGAGTSATGSFTFSAQPASEYYSPYYPGIVVGDVEYLFECSAGSGGGSADCTGMPDNTSYNTRNMEGYNTILIGDTLADTVLNVVAALNNNQGTCGFKDPTAGDTGYNTCFHNGTTGPFITTAAPQTHVTATSSGNTVTLTSTVAGAAGNCTTATCYTTYGWITDDAYEYGTSATYELEDITCTTNCANTYTGEMAGGVTGGANSCASLTTATFLTNAAAATEASNMAAALNACVTNFGGTAPVSAVASGSNVNLTARVAGTAGNSIQLATPSASPGSSSFTFSAQPSSELSSCCFPGLETGNQYWWFECASGSTGTNVCPTTDYYNRYVVDGSPVILIGDTLIHTLLNIVAAVNNLAQTSCGYRDPTAGDGAAYNTCYRTVGAAQTFVTAVSNGTNGITLTSTADPGNGTPTCYTNYGFVPYDVIDGEANYENITPFATTCNTGGVSGVTEITGFRWTFSTGTPACNGTVTPCNMGGGAGGVTSATMFAVDGVLNDDTAQLVAAINTAPNPANVGVTADCLSPAGSTGPCSTPSLIINSTHPGVCAVTSSLTSTTPGFTWTSSSLSGGSNGTQSATSFVFWNGCSELPAGQIVSNMVSAVNGNGTLSTELGAANTSGSSCTSNCYFTLTALANGPAEDYPLSTGFGSGTFTWTCPLGTSATAMCGGQSGLTWTFESASNGQTTVGLPTGPSGMVGDNESFQQWQASHAYAVDFYITDRNGNDETAIQAGTSGASTPTWCTTPGCITIDGSVHWENIGPSASANLYLGTGNGTGGNLAKKFILKGLQ